LGIFTPENRIAHGFACVTHMPKVVESCSKSQKTRQVFLPALKIFLVATTDFFWRHKWRAFRPPWPTSPGPGLKPLDDSISLKFILETRLQSKSFDTLDDLLGF